MAQTTKTAKRDYTPRVLAAMFTENTGRAMCDSGDHYGRNWERNRGKSAKEFLAEPSVELSFKYGDFDATLSAYHWLLDRLEYDAKETARFRKFADAKSRERDPWLALMQDWAERNAQGGEWDRQTVNTYNDDCWLSQTLQYTFYTRNEVSYVLMQVHGGCDVRGGYTAPRVFRCDQFSMWDYSQVSVYCNSCGAYWDLSPWDKTAKEDPVVLEVSEPVLPGMPTVREVEVPEWSDIEIKDHSWDFRDHKDPAPAYKPAERVIVWDDATKRGSCPVCCRGYLLADGPYPG